MSILKGLKLNSTNARGFLFFLLLTTVVATLIKLSKAYEISRTLNIEVVALPLNRSVAAVTPQALTVKAQTSGFALLRSTFDGQRVQIPYDALEMVAPGSFIFKPEEHKTTVQGSLSGDAVIVSVQPREVTFFIDSLSSKRVVVIPETSITYATGYSAANEIRTTPDSLTVVGPSEMLNEIQALRTKKINVTQVNASIKVMSNIDTTALSNKLKLSQNEVLVEQRVTRFTEGMVTVPITILNDTEGKLKILPKTVQIIYKVALDDFDTIAASDFLVTCNYNKVSSSRDYLALTLEREPSTIKGARLATKQVKYIIVND